MKNLIKLTLTLSLVVAFLLLCISVLTIGYTGIWLHTYNVFTQKTKVADIELSEIKSDEFGDYIDVKFTEYKQPSGLETFFNISSNKTQQENYKVYGDTIYVGGPIIKFKDELTLLNFKTMYKISKIYGRYSNNIEEINKSDVAQANSSYDVNDGYADWKTIFENFRSETILGQFYRLFIDVTQLSEPGQFASNRPLKYELYISNNGFLWELIEQR